MKFIKNTLRILAAAIGLAIALPAAAQTASYQSFIGQYGQVLLPWAANGTTTNYGTYYLPANNSYAGTNGFFFVKNYVQTNSTTYPYVSGWSPVWTQANPFSDVALWCNRDGTAPLAAFNLSLVIPSITNGLATNSFKITLTTINRTSDSLGGYSGPIYNNQLQNSFTFTATNAAAGTNYTTGYDTINVSTNLPQTFLQGALGLQFAITVGFQGATPAITWTNVTGTYSAPVTNTVSGIQILSAGISGWKPSAAQ